MKVTVLGAGGKWPSLCSVIVNSVTVSNGGNPCDTDTTPPVLSNCPSNINLISTGTSVVATWISPTATDNCTLTSSVSSNYNSGIAFPIGTTAIIYTAKDAKGNQATCSFNVIVTLNSPYPKVVLKASTHTVSQNQKVCIGISVDSFNNIMNYQFPILFNPAVLRFDSIIFNYPSFIEGGHSELTAIDALRGSLTFLNYAPVSTLPNNSKLFDLCFTSIGDANTSSDISFDNPQLFPTRFVRDGNYLLNTVSKIGRVTIQGTTPTTPDIALSIAATPNTYRQWTTNTFRITAKNNGSQAMNNIKVHFKYPNQTVKGGEVIPSVGTWTEYCSGGILCYEWSIPTLSTNATATLDVPLFILGATAPIIANTNLLTSTPTDGNTNNNVATITLAPAPPPSQMLAMPNRPKPSQFIPVVIQAISPNPTDGDVMIEIESIIEKEVRFDFYNTLGKVIKTEVRALKKGENRLAFEFWNYQNGIYFIQTNEGQGRGVPLKFVKL